MTPIASGWFYVPLQMVGERSGSLRERLTFRSKFAEPGEPPICMYTLARPGFIGVPMGFGLSAFRGVDFEDQRSDGRPITVPRMPDPNHPRVLNPAQQAVFMSDLYDCAVDHNVFCAMASTGSGKTVCALHTAARLGRSTIILVHLERLMHQWVDEIQDKLGLSRNEIGIVQGDVCQFDRPFVVAMMPSVSQRAMRYPREFYAAFGTMIVDEVHKVGSPMLSQVGWQFTARNRIGLSATPTRKDGAHKVVYAYVGDVRVVSRAEALPLDVYVQNYSTQSKLWGNNSAMRRKCLALDKRRNSLLVSLIVRLHASGRNTLVVGAEIAHIQSLISLCIDAGIPAKDIGQFTGQIRKVVQNDEGVFVKKSEKRKGADLDEAKKAKMIFATIGMIKEGIDIPRLDAGIDVVPFSDATQLIGRVRRPMPGKKKPIWVTILDSSCPISTRLFHSRCKDYRSSNASIKQMKGR